jgi:hypothetical protein
MTLEPTERLIRSDAPIVDKLALTVPVRGASEQAHAIETIEQLQYRHGFQGRMPRFRGGYAYSVVLPLSGLLLQAKPTRTGAKRPAFARLEFNPSKAGVAGVSEVRTIAATLFSAEDMRHASVSRIDVAVDMHGVRISNLAVRSRRHQKSMLVFGREGNLETIYVGDRGSGSQVTIYDKAAQLRETKSIHLAGPCTRFEARIRTYIPVNELSLLKNPFFGIDVFCGLDDLSIGTPHHHQMFLDSIARRGLHAALRMLPASRRQRYERAIAKRRCSYWKPDELWSGWDRAVEALGLIPLCARG